MGDNTSPILLTDVPQPIATFNRPFELSELVGNLDGVMYLYSGEAVNVTCVSDVEEGEPKYFLAYDNGESHIGDLSVDGNTLLCSEKGNENYLFDLDFKHQNRKFWPSQLNEVVGITSPSLLSDPSKYLICKVVQSNSGKQVRLQVNNDEPISVDAGGTIAPAYWFDSNAYGSIDKLVELILKLEYDDANAGGIAVATANDSIGGTDGTWNLYTEGSPFIPLRIISRFPNGSPIKTASQQEKIICSFNRVPSGIELANLEILHFYGDKPRILTYDGVTSDGLVIFADDNIDLAIRIVNNSLYVTAEADGATIYDIDFDHQFRRALPAGFVKMNVQIPQLLDNPSAGQGFGIMHDNAGPQNFGVCTAQDNSPYIVEGNTWTSEKGGWADSMTWAYVQSLLQGIIAMEFEGFDVEPPFIDPVDYREALATGFVVTPLIPQTLS